jgi:poly-gamma-glutamate synthesis protein (capsule biosynthesis protein)
MTALVAPPRSPFAAVVGPVPAAVRERMTGSSWRDDPRCPAWDELRYLELPHVTFDGGIARGELVVAAAIAGATVALFARLHALGFPIRQARLVDDFGASDDASMAADNTSAFNFRVVAGSSTLSQHAFGRAIDLNPVENPWIVGDRLVPPAGAAYRDRAVVRPGMIVRPGPITALFDELGWEWGGDWHHALDLHHIVRRA